MKNGFLLTDPAQANATQEEIFARTKQVFGFVPNILNAFSESPVLANAMIDLYARMNDTSFSPTEAHIVLQTINVFNECHYCVPAHSTTARKGGVSPDIDDALRNNTPLNDPKLESLRTFTRAFVEQRGHLQGEQIQDLLDAGYTRQSVLDVVFLHTVKSLTNYGNHIVGTDIDAVFAAQSWEPGVVANA